MKVVFNPNLKNKNFKHEVEFCKSYFHRCLTMFYGFLMKNGKIIGFVYEYMCNGTLYDYYTSKKNEVNEILIKTSLSRISQGIEYLHSNFLIHRDLKPSNILLNHDNLPFISDFDTIKCIYNEVEKTNDIGSVLYSSPEQDASENVSYPTDIYSFGLIIFFLFEKKDMRLQNNLDYIKKKR